MRLRCSGWHLSLPRRRIRPHSSRSDRALTERWPEMVKVEGIEILHVLKNVYMLAGGGANITVQIGDEGVTMVDSGVPGQGERSSRRAAADEKPLRYLVNTSADADHAGGNDGSSRRPAVRGRGRRGGGRQRRHPHRRTKTPSIA